MTAADYVTMASDPHVLGDPLLKTQHFIGATRWEKLSDTEVVGWHQLRVPHQKYTDESRTEIAVKGHAHGTNQHWYRKVDGVWKFAGLAPEIRWGEFDFDKVFAGGRETFGDEENVLKDMAVTNGFNGEVTNSKNVQASTDGEAAHTATGIESTLENMPAQVKAQLVDEAPGAYNGHSMGSLIEA